MAEDIYGRLQAEQFLGLDEDVRAHGYKLEQLRSSDELFVKSMIAEDAILDYETGERLYDVKTKYITWEKMKMIGKVWGTRDPRVYQVTREEGAARFMIINDSRNSIKHMKIELAGTTIREGK